MNDFTKSELSVIHLAIMRDMSQFAHILKTSHSMLELCNKLEAMIDNYCENFECPHCHSLREKNLPNLFCCGEYEYDNQ